MKFLIIFILILTLGMLGTGFYLKNTGNANGEIVIGLGVLLVAFILMPLFIYHRYKNKKMSDFTFEKFKNDLVERSKSDKIF
jgi:cytochrome c-type biogenesis protein CcmH/NrfG